MREEKYQPKMPDIMEAIFDAGYLIFDLVAAILFFTYAKGNTLFILYGILTLTLGGGDAFHLVPRIIRAACGTNDRIKKQLGIGLQISSIFSHNNASTKPNKTKLSKILNTIEILSEILLLKAKVVLTEQISSAQVSAKKLPL